MLPRKRRVLPRPFSRLPPTTLAQLSSDFVSSRTLIITTLCSLAGKMARCGVVAHCLEGETRLVALPLTRSKSHRRRQAETCAKHPLCGGDIPNLMDGNFAFHFCTAGLKLKADFIIDALADIVKRGCVVGLDSKAMRMYQRQLGIGVWRE